MDLQFFPHLPQIVYDMLPSSRVVAMVCNPVERAWSEFNHLKRWNLLDKNVTWESLIGDTLESRDEMTRSKNFFYNEVVAKGFYADHIKGWIDRFGRDKVTVLNLEDLSDEAQVSGRRSTVIRELLEFLNLPEKHYNWTTAEEVKPAFANTQYKGRKSVPESFVEAFLPVFYKHNIKLVNLLGKDIGMYALKWNKRKRKNKDNATASLIDSSRNNHG